MPRVSVSLTKIVQIQKDSPRSTKLKTITKNERISVKVVANSGFVCFHVSFSVFFPCRIICSLAATRRSLKKQGKNMRKLISPSKTFAHLKWNEISCVTVILPDLTYPAAVYMFIGSLFMNKKPSVPRGVTAACKAGPMTKPRTWASDIIETELVLSDRVVAAETYDRQTAMLALETPTKKRAMNIQYLTSS